MLTPRSARRLLARATILGALTALTSACGGLGPGDSVYYRVAFDALKAGAECFPNDQIPESIKDDVNSFRSGTTLILYVAGDEEALLDVNGQVLSGSIDSDTYEFSGTEIDVDYPPGQTILDSDGDGLEDGVNDPLVDADMDGLADDLATDMMVDTDADMLDDRIDDPLVDANMDGEDDRYREVGASALKFIETDSTNVSMTVDGDTVSGTVRIANSDTCEGTTCPMDYDTSCSYSTTFKGIEVEDVDLAIGSDGAQQPPAPGP